MKFALESTVTGKIMIGKEIRVAKAPYEYVLTPDRDGWLASIMISAEITHTEQVYSRLEPSDGTSKAKIIIERDRETYERIINEFQELESITSFASGGNLGSIDWHSPKEHMIPESQDEEAEIHVASFEATWEYPEQQFNLTHEAFRELVYAKDSYRSLTVIKAFFREGTNEFNKFRYINAFYNLYFILEDLYGKGKTGTQAVIASFRKSPEFRESVDWVLKNHVNNHPRHRLALQNLCSQLNLGYESDGLIDLLGKVRNNLHHYSTSDAKKFWTPFRQKDFESIAFFTLGLAVRGIAFKEVEISKSLGQQHQ